MYKYVLDYDGGFLRDSSDFEWGIYETKEEAQEDAELAKESYMEGWDLEGSEYEEELFSYEILEI